MRQKPSPLRETVLREDLPLYPPPIQAVRVTGGTIPGPSGYASSSILGPSLYIGFTQQLHSGTLLPRDREPCLVLDLNRVGLAPGYYTNARLAGIYQSLPIYEVGGSPVASPLTPMTSPPLPSGSGITPAQAIQLSTLSPAQFAVLNNLTPCQLNTLVTALPISQIHTLASGVLTPTQLTNIINVTTPTEFLNIYSQLTTSQIINLTTTLNQQQTQNIVQTLTPAQIQTLIINLTTSQLQILSGMTPQEIKFLITNLTTSQLQTFLTISPLPHPHAPGIRAETGTTYTFVIGDLGKLVTFNNAAAMSGTLAAPGTVGPGWFCVIWNKGAGTLTLTPASGQINGSANLSVPASTGTTVWSDGSNYQISSGGAGIASSGGSTDGTTLDANYVAAIESTTSTSYTDLSTEDTVTFTLSATENILIEYQANTTVGSNIMAESVYNVLNVDGSDDGSTGIQFFPNNTASTVIATTCQAILSLTSGSHTVKVRHKTGGGTSCSWQNRTLKAILLP